jgi:flavodoxin
MQTLIIFESFHHGNTERVARALAEPLGARLVRASEVSADEVERHDLIGFGSGIYFGRHHRNLRELVKRLAPMRKDAFVFSTSGANLNQNFWLVFQLRRAGFVVLGDFFCPGFDTVGPLRFIGGVKRGRPDARDLEAARAFARQLVPRPSRAPAEVRP